MSANPEIAIIGSGIGGATVAAALAPAGKSIVILERGQRLADSNEARNDIAIFGKGAFRPDESWLNGDGQAFNPGNYYYVGGNSKFYGAVLLRYRAEDFATLRHQGGESPAWPIDYDDFEPWYQAAEQLFQVRGDAQQDPTEPRHSAAYAFPPVPDEPAIADMRRRLQSAGVTPSSLPLAVDVERWTARAPTPWDGFPDTTGAKLDAESVSLERALKHSNVTLETGAEVVRLHTTDDNRIGKIDYRQGSELHQLTPGLVVLSAGAVNSAVLLLRSVNDDNPNGLANRSDMVGRNFMNHNCSALLAIHPFRINDAIYQKTLQFNNFYLSGGRDDMPLGNVQLLGKISANILASQSSLPKMVANWIARRSVDWYVMSEDLPNPDSRITLKNGRITLDWKRSNWDTHLALVNRAKSVLRRAGFPFSISRPFDRRTPSHQCGTTRFGHDPQANVLDLYCRAHDHANLFIVDAGFLPNSAAVNPALTIAAQALRVGDHILQQDLAA